MSVTRWRWGEPLDPLRTTLERGGILAIPTESSYGLAVDPRSTAGVGAIYALKRRQQGKPLPVVVASIAQAAAELGMPLDAPGLVQVAPHWPAPLSLLVRVRRSLPAAATSSQLAVRVPAHERLRRLLAELATPLTATSANRSGEPAITDPERVALLLDGVDAVLVDDGLLPGGAPSTVVSWGDGKLRVLRPGRYPIDRLGEADGPLFRSACGNHC